MSVRDGYTEGYDRGRSDGARVDLLIAIEYDDIGAALNDPAREARSPERSSRLSCHRTV